MKGQAFLLYGMSAQAASLLREAMAATNLPRVQTFGTKATDKLLEARKPFYVDVSGHSYLAVRGLHQNLARNGYQPHIYVKEAAMPTVITEGWLALCSTYGMLRAALRDDMLVIKNSKHLREAAAKAFKPKQPTEVDRLKLAQQKREIMQKTQDSNEILQAKERDLEKKAREKTAELQKPKVKMKTVTT